MHAYGLTGTYLDIKVLMRLAKSICSFSVYCYTKVKLQQLLAGSLLLNNVISNTLP